MSGYTQLNFWPDQFSGKQVTQSTQGKESFTAGVCGLHEVFTFGWPH